MLRRLFFNVLCYLPLLALAQPKTLTAIKTSQAPRIDGDLNDPVWQQAPIASDFMQYAPSYGAAVSAKTEVKILYDNEALYIGAYLYDDPSLIRKQITARDGEQQQDVDFFSVFVDTYNDQQNGFQFLVTTADVQTDSKLTPTANPGFNQFGDKSWDAVWESRVQIKSDGWVVEMRIPYISLRFSKKDIQTWGLQFLRYMRRNNEQNFWNPVDPNVNGFVNQFGKYVDLKNIQPPLRLSFYPYLGSGIRVNEKGNDLGTQWLRSGGMDVKYGINESFTLDATLIPDFGQVVSDDVINNLTPFEQKFNENRPFFTEGTELFNKAGLFYSRRIGALPSGYYNILDTADIDPNIRILKNPSVTQLYNAIKFSGRTKEKLGIGVLNAIAAPMYATIFDQTTGAKSQIQTSPLTNYNIVVLDQALQGRSFITFTNANTIRNGNARDANVASLDVSLYDKSNTYNLRSFGRYSKIFSSNSYDGFNTGLKLGKVSGKVQYFVQGDLKSTNYDPRDLGFIQTADITSYTANVSYHQFTSTKNFLSYAYTLNAYWQRMYRPNAAGYSQFELEAFWFFKNFWDVTLNLGALPVQHDYFVLGRPLENVFVNRPAYGYVELEGSTDSRKKLFFSYDWQQASFFGAAPKKNYHNAEFGLRYRFSNKVSVSVSHHDEAETNYIVNSGIRETNGDPIVGFVNFKDITTTLSGIYNLTPKLNLNFRLRHNWSKVPYKSFANVDKEGNTIPRQSPIYSLDENVNFFNVDAFLSWDFRLGCNLTVGYKNWIGDTNAINGILYSRYLNNFSKAFDVSHGNELTVKVIYFLDYNQFKKKK
jgi:Domain of unknown function (DUF5916)/Carbohydrate family 9 binding domain-like